MRTHFLVHRQLSSLCVLMVAVGELSGVSFDKGTSPIPEGSTHMIHSCPNTITLGVRFQQTNLRRSGHRHSLVAQTVKNLPKMWETSVQSMDREDPLENGKGYPLQYSYLENSMDIGAWRATVYEIAKSWT